MSKCKDKIYRKQKEFEKKIHRAKAMWLANPTFFINPYNTYKTYMDILIDEKDNNLYISSTSINNFYSLRSVFYDKQTEMVQVELQEKFLDYFGSWRYLIARLESCGDQLSYQQAQHIKKFAYNYERFIMHIATGFSLPVMNGLEAKDFFDEYPVLNIREDFIKEPIVIIKYTQEKYNVKKKWIVFSKSFIELIGYNVDEWITHVLRNGLPDYISKEKEDFLGNYGPFLENMLFTRYVNHRKERNAYLLSRSREKIPIIQKILMFPSYSIEKGYSVDYMWQFKKDETRNIGFHKDINIADVFNKAQDCEREQELNMFFKTFYGHELPGNFCNIDKTCRYKSL